MRLGGISLPIEERADIFGLSLTHDKFLTVRQSQEPSLAGQHAHFTNVINVDDGIPMNALEHTATEFGLECA